MKINTPSKGTNNQAHRSKTDSYYTSRKHKSLREQAWRRANGMCEECARQGKMKPLLLHTTRENKERMAFGDHIVPREAGGKDELDNYQILRKPCHDKKSNKDKQYYR